MKKIGIWGLGVVGKSAITYFHGKGYNVQALDRREPNEQEKAFLTAHNISFFLQDQLTDFLLNNDYILASCGIDLRPYQEFNHKFLSELDIFGTECKKPIIAITGSVGKTTVTHLLSQLISHQGKTVFTGGNIGVGLLDSIQAANAADYVILEVSSFQLERCKTFRPSMAICTNIYPNHLDRHGSLESYIHAKLQIIAQQRPADRSLSPLSIREQVKAKNLRNPLCFFSKKEPTRQELSHLDVSDALYFLHNSKLMLSYQTNTCEIFDFKELPKISYLENVIMLSAAIHILGLSLDNFVTILNEQELPHHRLEKVASINGVDFYNDSKATIPASTLAAIEKIQGKPIILFLGGVSKGVDRSEFVAQLKDKVTFVYCFGKEAEELKKFCDSNNIQSLATATLDDAFVHLPNFLKDNNQILFSPAGASYDLFADYQKRGEHFIKLVQQIKSVA